MGGAGTGGRPRRQEPDDHRVLHRERGCHGCPHGRLLLHGAHAHDPRGAAEETPEVLLRYRRGDPGDRRHERPVRPRSEDRPRRRHRDQPSHLALVGPGLQGNRVPHRPDLGHAGRRAHPGGNPLLEGRDPGEVHPLGRLRSREVCPLGFREIPGCRGQARHADARRGRGDEHREDLQGSAPEGDPLPREGALRTRVREGLQ